MLLDLNKLHGQREHFNRRFEPSVFDPQDEDYRVVAPVELSIDVEKAGGHTFRVTGRATTTLELECGRCLEPFQMPVDVPIELRYVQQSENTGAPEREISDDDLTIAFLKEGALDLIDLLREQFQLTLPMKPLCQDDCKGLCLECGANRNTTDCGHAPAWEDPRLAPLKGLLTNDKEN